MCGEGGSEGVSEGVFKWTGSGNRRRPVISLADGRMESSSGLRTFYDSVCREKCFCLVL